MNYSVVVQAAPTINETEYLLGLYDRYEMIAGVVGWLDLESSDFNREFERLNQHPGFVGIRPMLQDIQDDKWILRPQVLKNIEILVEEDFPIDLLVLPRHLSYIVDLLNRFPGLRAVVDHAAKPNIKDRIMEPWKEQLAEIAAFDHVMCKLSGLITEADHEHWTDEQLKPYVHHVTDVFGTDSVMFGSDWPVCRLAGSYQNVYKALNWALPNSLTSEDLKDVFGRNAARFYKKLRLKG